MTRLRKNKATHKLIAIILFIALIFSSISVNCFAETDNNDKIANLVKLAVKERSKYG